MRHQKRHKKSFNLKDSIFIRDGNYTFFLPIAILALLVLFSWSWVFLKIPPISDMAESFIASQNARNSSHVLNENKDIAPTGTPEEKSSFGALTGKDNGSFSQDLYGSGSKIIKNSKYDTPSESNGSVNDFIDNVSEEEEKNKKEQAENTNPQIQNITFSSDIIYAGQSYDICAVAIDNDGQQLSYSWSASAGLIEGSETSCIKWTAPGNCQSCEITVVVKDYLGAADSKTVSVNTVQQQEGEDNTQPSDESQIAQDIAEPVRKIVFVSSQAGNKDIFSMNLDGGALTQLSSGGQDDMYPAVSPDGKKIAYCSAIGTTWQIFIMNWDGSAKTQITNIPSRCGYPSFSYDAKHIFFEIYEEGSWEIYVMATDGKNIRRLTLKPGIDNWHPSAHPCQDKTLYESGPQGSQEIWQIDIDGTDNTKISKPGRNYRVPRYSPDGSKIAFMGKDASGREQVFVMDSSGENIVQLTDMPGQARLPSFSPDGNYIVFNTAGGGGEIFIMNADGSGQKQLTNFPGEDEVAVFMYH